MITLASRTKVERISKKSNKKWKKVLRHLNVTAVWHLGKTDDSDCNKAQLFI